MTLIKALSDVPNYVTRPLADNWTVAYNKRPVSLNISGSTTKTVSLWLGDGSILSSTFIGQEADINNYTTGVSFDSTSGNITTSRSGLSNLITPIDGRYLHLTGGTLSGSLTAPTFIGSLAGNASTTTLATNSTLLNGQASTYYTNPVNIIQTASHRFVTDAEKSNWNTSYSYSQVGHIPLTQKGSALGVVPLNSGAKIEEIYLPDSVLGQVEYQGTYNATTNTPTLGLSSTTNKGHYYVVSVAGGIYEVGDWVISNGVAWQKVDNTDAVTAVYGRLGNILAIETDYSSFYPLLSSSYNNPSWINQLAWSKIITTPTTLAGYGITDSQSTLSGTGLVKSVTGTISYITDNSGNWDTAFGWGNHGIVGYTTASSINTFTNKSGNISQWTNDSGYITSASVGNGTLTMNVSGSGLSGSASFTANQSGASTFTVTSNATSSPTASTIALRDVSGYLNAVYFYSSNAARSTSGINSLTGKDAAGAGFMYEFTAGAVQTFLGLGSMAYASTGSYYTAATSDGRYAYVGGSNASGTWGINITGNAATSTTSTYTNYINPARVSTEGHLNALRSNFMDTHGQGGTFPGSTSHIQGIAMRHDNYSNAWGWQLASQYDRTGEVWARWVNGGTFSSWVSIITSTNIGSQSVSYANSAGSSTISSTVSINYNNDSNSTYQMLWGSGNSVYGTAGVYLNPATDTLYATNVGINGAAGYRLQVHQGAADWTIHANGTGGYGLLGTGSVYAGYFQGPILGTASLNIAGNATAASFNGNWNGYTLTTAATANTVVLRDSGGDSTVRYSFASYQNSGDDVSAGTITYIMAKFGDNYHRSATAAKVQAFLGLGSLAYSSATIPTATSQLTNNSGYITGYSETDTLASVTSRGSSTGTYSYFNGGISFYYIGSASVPGSTYGTIRADGTSGGYGGLYLYSCAGTVVGMYDTAGNGGDFDPTTGWHTYWYRLNTCLGIGGSTTAAGYRAYVNGSLYTAGNNNSSGSLSASNFSGSSSGTNTGDQINISGNAGTAGSSVNFMSTSHAGSFWLVNNWTGSYWQITSNHGAGVQVAYSNDSGNSATTSQRNFSGNVTADTLTGTSGGFNSDINLKNVYTRILSSKYISNLISPFIFNWNDDIRNKDRDKTKLRIGYGAQEIFEIFPEAVYNVHDGTLAVDYTQVHTLLIDENTKRIQELERQIEILKKKLQ